MASNGLCGIPVEFLDKNRTLVTVWCNNYPNQKKNILCVTVCDKNSWKSVYMCPPTSPTCHLFGIWQQLYFAAKPTIPTTSRENVWQWQIENSWHIPSRVVNKQDTMNMKPTISSLYYYNFRWTFYPIVICFALLLSPLYLCMSLHLEVSKIKKTIKRCLAI